jgi:tetratricopeptide (TPR) repeat protein
MSEDYDEIEDYRKEVRKYMDRAMYFYEKQEYAQALQDLEKAFGYQADIFGEQENRRQNDFSKTVYYEEDVKLRILSTLGEIISLIIKLFLQLEQLEEAKYFIGKLRLIAGVLEENRNRLTVQVLTSLDSFALGLEQLDRLSIVSENSLEDLSSRNSIFSNLRKSLNRICKLDMCLLDADSSSDSCFIATAAYGTSSHPDLDTFREFRDRKLLRNYFLRSVVSSYYKYGPRVARIVVKSPVIQNYARSLLEKLAKLMRNRGVTSK